MIEKKQYLDHNAILLFGEFLLIKKGLVIKGFFVTVSTLKPS